MSLLDAADDALPSRHGAPREAASLDGELLPRRDARSGPGEAGVSPSASAQIAPAPFVHHGYAIRSSAGLDILRGAITGVDGYLSYRCGVKPFDKDERCLLRYAVLSSPSRVVLSDGTKVEAGEPVVDLHLWNEHIPPVPRQGPDMAWARLVGRWMKLSLALLAEALDANVDMQGVKAIRARTNFVGWSGQGESLSRLIGRFGFEDVDEGPASMRGRIHDAFENILIGALTWTHNPEALRRDKLIRQRRPVWMSAAALRNRHDIG